MDDRVIRDLENREQIERVTSQSRSRGVGGQLPAFPVLLQRLREERGLSKADLAKRTALDPSTITRFEQGARQPERETILQIAEALVLPMPERDLLLASAGFRSELWDDPLLVELVQLLNEPGIPSQAREEARSTIRMTVAYLKLQRLQGY